MNNTLWLPGLIFPLAFNAIAAQPALTIYNQNFAVVRDTVPLNLRAGTNEVRYANATGALEPDSVVLRDLVGEHKQTDFQAYFENVPGSIDPTTGLPLRAEPAVSTNSPVAKLEPPPWIKESFEITLRNHKSIPVEIRVVEHLFRWSNWEIRKPSDQFKKTDAQTIEFRVTVKPEEEKVISYTAHYTAHYW